jgi:hypothetical protein
VNRTAVAVALEREHAGTLGIFTILLYQFSRMNAGDQVPDRDSICCKLIVTMVRDSDFTSGYKGDNLLQHAAHT